MSHFILSCVRTCGVPMRSDRNEHMCKPRNKKMGTWPTGNGLMSKVSAQTMASICHGQKWPAQVSFLVTTHPALIMTPSVYLVLN